MRRLTIALAAALGWLALTAAAPAQAALTAAQFAAIDGVYTAFIPFDGAGATAADRAGARAVCRALDSADPLLDALGKGCIAQMRVGDALIAASGCKGRTSCLLRARRVQRALSELLARTRASNRAVEAAMLGPACQPELRANMATLTFFTRLRAGWALLEHAVRIRSKRLARRARRRIDALSDPDTRSIAKQRDDYRVNCAPPA